MFCVDSQHPFKLPTSKPHTNYKFCNQNAVHNIALNTKVQIVFIGNVEKLEKPFNVRPSIITALRVLTPTALNACSKENFSQLEYPITTGVHCITNKTNFHIYRGLRFSWLLRQPNKNKLHVCDQSSIPINLSKLPTTIRLLPEIVFQFSNILGVSPFPTKITVTSRFRVIFWAFWKKPC